MVNYVNGYSFFSPISVFDSLLMGDKSFAELGATISTMQKKKISPHMYLQSLVLNATAMDAAKELYRMATSGFLAFQQNYLDPVIMWSPSIFEPGKSIETIRPSRNSASDFLMYPGNGPSSGLSNLMAQNRMDSIYGPATIRILEAMGYTTKSNPKFPLLTISEHYRTDKYDPSDSFYVKNPTLGKTIAI